MPANKNATPGPSTTKQMAMDLKAELVAMEAEKAAEEKRKQELLDLSYLIFWLMLT